MEYIFIYGEIQSTDGYFFRSLDNLWPADKKLPIVWLESGGGYASPAKEIGHILRKRHGIVASGNPITKLDEYFCESACVFIAAGAEERHLNQIGLHSPYLIDHKGKKNQKIRPANQDLLNNNQAYLAEMGINPIITDIMHSTPSEKMTEFQFDENADESQQIIILGFHMPPSDNFSNEGFPKAAKHRYQDDDEIAEFAALQGDVWAAVALADYYTQETETRLPSPILERKWLQFAIDRGNVNAMHNMGVSLSGSDWGKPNYKLAATYYKMAVDQGFGPSQNNLGWNYYVAHGVKRNIPLAVHLITASALQGEPFAYGSLCEMYGNGGVFPRDNITAYMFCDLALDHMQKGSGLNASVKAMTKISKNMTTAEIMNARQRASQWKPLKYPASVMKGDEDD